MERLRPYIINTVKSAVFASTLAACSGDAKPLQAPVPSVKPAQDLGPITTSEPVATLAPNPLDDLSDTELGFFYSLNGDRIQAGLSPLKLDPTLAHLARERSAQLQKLWPSPLSHFDQNGNLILRMILDRNSIPFQIAGENLAENNFSQKDTVKDANIGLMNSPTHRANILNPGYNIAGVGVAGPDQNGEYYYTQLFVETP